VFGLLLAIAILDGLLLGVIVLLQAGKGDGLAAMGGGGGTVADGIMGGRQAATLLTKATWVTGGLFLAVLFTLSILSSRARAPDPLLRDQFTAPTAPPPLLNTTTDTGGAAGGATLPLPTTPPATTTTGN
jgi:preprotein translocase subunit SecG